jgi:hypothetical protein
VLAIKHSSACGRIRIRVRGWVRIRVRVMVRIMGRVRVRSGSEFSVSHYMLHDSMLPNEHRTLHLIANRTFPASFNFLSAPISCLQCCVTSSAEWQSSWLVKAAPISCLQCCVDAISRAAEFIVSESSAACLRCCVTSSTEWQSSWLVKAAPLAFSVVWTPTAEWQSSWLVKAGPLSCLQCCDII